MWCVVLRSVRVCMCVCVYVLTCSYGDVLWSNGHCLICIVFVGSSLLLSQLRVKPDLHIDVLDIIAYGDLSLRRPSAEFLFAQWPPENTFQNKQGVTLPHAFADAAGARVLQQAVIRLCDDPDPFVSERGLVLLQRLCMPDATTNEDVRFCSVHI